MKSTILNFQLSAIKLLVVGKYEVGSLFADKGIPSLHLSQLTKQTILKHDSKHPNIIKRTTTNINKRTTTNINKRTTTNVNKRTTTNINTDATLSQHFYKSYTVTP